MAANGSTLRKGLLVYLASSFGVPVLLHLHGGDVEIFYRALGPRPRRALVGMLARADGIVVLGSYWRHFIVEELRLDPGRVHVLPNGVPDPGRRASAEAPAACRILFLGDVCDNKGIPELLAALARPQLRPLAWQMLLAGKGDSARYQALAGSLGIGERVSFLGWVPGKAANELLASSDVLVLPSRFEGLPMVVLEAMAHGLSVIATPVGAVPDAITHEETGLLVAVGDSAELAEALRRVIADATLRRRLERAARERFLRSFQITAVTQQLEAIYAKYARAELRI
jgi:glycosyltransferase involved in cell wall biosynthesis